MAAGTAADVEEAVAVAQAEEVEVDGLQSRRRAAVAVGGVQVAIGRAAGQPRRPRDEPAQAALERRLSGIEDQVLAQNRVDERFDVLQQTQAATVLPLHQLLEVLRDDEVLVVDAEGAAEEPVGGLDGVTQSLRVDVEAAFA